jgi:hypothetical protein
MRPRGRRFDAGMRSFMPRLPAAGTVFDYCVDVDLRAWQPWEARLPAAFRCATATAPRQLCMRLAWRD